ncbi:MAG TPA: HepT-like ribonuclease domain-containing protein [Stellaceae bacterium]|jgi:uncharacterized protein with HEPN domain|nr:HepT-like ribonuclease domain-containing protein [Stellaceae bacterium]
MTRSTRSKSLRGPLLDIVENIHLAMEFVRGLDYRAFYEDRRTVYAVIRCLEIISEASRRLPEELKARHTQIPWRDIAAAGNIYRHEYEDVQEQRVWRTVNDHLMPLLRAVEGELSKLPE